MRRALLLIALAACDKDNSDSSVAKPSEAPRHLAGVYPEQFKCESVASLDALGAVLGGTVRVIDTPMSMPKGVPHPCNYEVASTPLEYWTFDIDCREGYKKRADGLFAQYRQTSTDLVQAYNELADAGGIKKTDAGIVIHAPVDAVDVQVGAKGLDHHGQGLLFIDDDAPCYVRVVGPDAQRRLLLAQLVAKNLTFDNAPMTPRAMK